MAARALPDLTSRLRLDDRDLDRARSNVRSFGNDVSRSMTQAGGSVDRFGGVTGRVGVSTRGVFASIGTAMRGVAVAAAGLGAVGVGLGGIAVKAVQLASANEQARVGFTNMLGSAKAADSFLGQLQAFAAKTPFEFPDLVTASQQLLAMGVNAKDVIPYMTGIGDAVASLGGGKEVIDQVTTAIGQMAAKGKIQSDEILQLTEAGIPALKILASQYGVTTAQMQDFITQGKVAASDALPKLIAGIEQGTDSTAKMGGMMAAQSQTMAGQWSNLQDNVTSVLTRIGIDITDKFDLRGKLQGVSEIVGGVNTLVTELDQGVAPFQAFKAGLTDAGFGQVATTLDNIGTTIGRVTGFVDQNSTAFKVLGGVIGAVLLPTVVNFGIVAGVSAVQGLVGMAVGAAQATAAFAVQGAAVLFNNAQLWGFVAASVALRGIQIAGAAVTGIMTAAQWALNIAMDANPVGLLTIGLAALVGGLVWAYKNIGPVHDAIDGMGRIFIAAGSWIGSTWSGVIAPALSNLGSTVGSVFSAIGSHVHSGLSSARGVVVSFIRAVDGIPVIGGALRDAGLNPDNVPGFAHGGIVPGLGSGDTTLARLTPGEVVLNRDAVAMLGGPGQANQLNDWGLGAASMTPGSWGGQCLYWVSQVLNGAFAGIPMASGLAPYINRTSPAPGEVFVSVLPPFGHTGFVLGGGSVIDSNWVGNEIVGIHALRDIPDIAGYIDVGAKLGTIGSALTGFLDIPGTLKGITSDVLAGLGGWPGSVARKLLSTASDAIIGRFDGGGWLMPGQFGYNGSTTPEYVNPPGSGDVGATAEAQLAELRTSNALMRMLLQKMGAPMGALDARMRYA